MNTIIGIIVAVVIMFMGLVMILKKPKPVEPSLESDLQINPESNQPIIPRHVRDQLVQHSDQSAVTARVEPSLNHDVVDENSNDNIDASQVQSKSEVDTAELTAPHSQADTIAEKEKTTDHPEIASTVDNNTVAQPEESERVVTPEIETVEIADFDGESNLLDLHLHQQQRSDDESSLATAERIIALNVYANPRRALSGDKALKILHKYGLRFGEMSCFHRYEHTDEPSALMFSVLRITDHGPAGFDLESLSGEQIQGLAFFLALPNRKAVTGYDMMTSIAGLIARDIDGMIYDEENLEFTQKQKEHWRHYVMDYHAS